MQGKKKQQTSSSVSDDPLVLGGSTASASSAPSSPHKVFDKGVWKRGATITVVAPTVIYLILNPVTHSVLVWLLIFVGMVEWTAMKRHLKVALLHEDGEKFEEYPSPVAKTNLFIICKCLACSFAVVPATFNAELFSLFMASYFMFWVVFTLMGQNKAEIVAADARKKVRSFPAAGGSLEEDSSDKSPPISPITLSSLAPKERFLQQELSIIANKSNTDLFLSFALEYFGFCWIMGGGYAVLLVRLGPAGNFCNLLMVTSNWANDIVALLVGRTLKGKTRPLYPRISPNKSLEGAVAGTLANGIFASLVCTAFYNPDTMYLGQDVLPVWFSFFLLGLFFGVVGVVGDLLQSLFKRSARIKDTGSFFPGHGGVLDRTDGLLLCCPIAYWMMWAFQRYATPAGFGVVAN